LLPAAVALYRDIEKSIGTTIVHGRSIWRHLKDIKAENVWDSRIEDPSYERYVKRPADPKALLGLFNGANRFGVVTGGFQIDVRTMIRMLRQRWLELGFLKEEKFDESQLLITERGYRYKDVSYRTVILAIGYQGIDSQLFVTDNYRPVKGEVLMIEIDHIPNDQIIKYGKFIVPLGDNLYWIGSNYQHTYSDNQPDEVQVKSLYHFLNKKQNRPYKVVEHICGIRPATKYRRPLIGEHPTSKGLYLFNGLGTKGVSLAPYFAKRLIKAIESISSFEETKAFRDSFHV